jgi:hypothetical protein
LSHLTSTARLPADPSTATRSKLFRMPNTSTTVLALLFAQHG